jgi:tetratricopeptide (TPR) repeat protein
MKKTAYLGFSLLLILALAAPGNAQNWTDNAEYDAYMAMFNEADPAKKCTLGETFLNEKKSAAAAYRLQAFQITINACLQGGSAAKVYALSDAVPQLLENPDVATKAYAFSLAMTAAQQADDFAKIVEYGDKVLAADPGGSNAQMALNAQITLSSLIPERLPEAAGAKNSALDKAFKLASDARVNANKVFNGPKPEGVTDQAWNAEAANIRGQIHSTFGLIHLHRMEYDKAVEEYKLALQINPKDGLAHFRIGSAYSGLASAASANVLKAIQTENEAKASRADQIMIDELVAQREAIQADWGTKRDAAIDHFASAVAIGGVVLQPAREQLEKLYQAKHESLDGLDQLINQKKSQLGL